MAASFIYAVHDWMSYLHHPPPSSWVARAAATFRILALLLIIPCVFLTALDVASYLVVRTLGADSAHRLEPVSLSSDYAVPDPKLDTISPGPTMDQESHKPPDVSISSQIDTASGTHLETYFATSTDANLALSGEGIFSPPGSRSASPPIMRHPRSTAVGTTVETDRMHESEDAAVMRKRGSAGMP